MAEIGLWTGAAAQKLVVAEDLEKAFGEPNAAWAKARKEFGY